MSRERFDAIKPYAIAGVHYAPKAEAPPRFICHKPQHNNLDPLDGSPCPHCIEDEKILEERIEVVADVVNQAEISRDDVVAALRSLVREIRR